MKKNIMKKALLLATIGLVAAPINMFAHGYVKSPKSRIYVGASEERNAQKYGAGIYEPQSLEAPKGFPLAGPADGKIASANGARGTQLDVQKENYWKNQEITTGPQQFSWFHTAPHRTTKWHYYMTKTGWNPNEALKRADLEFLGETQNGGAKPGTTETQTVDIPSDREGYHVIVAVWDIADTVNAFYQVIDVNVTKKDTGVSVAAPTNLHTMGVTTDSAKLMWSGQAGQTYAIYRDGLEIARTDKTSFNDTGLIEATTYNYYVKAIDGNGNISEASESLSVTTQKDETNNKPLQPTGLHTMSVGETAVDLMWTEREAGMTYAIYRDNVEVGRVSGNEFKDTNLTADTSYVYTVQAINEQGITSDVSEPIVVQTKAVVSELPAPKNLNLKEVTENMIRIAWYGPVGQKYVVYRDGVAIRTTTSRGLKDMKVTAGTTYNYYVKAIDAAGNLSEASKTLSVTTPGGNTSDTREFKLGSLIAPELYSANEVVSHNGKQYKSLVTHYNYGDITWSPDQARSLFAAV